MKNGDFIIRVLKEAKIEDVFNYEFTCGQVSILLNVMKSETRVEARRDFAEKLKIKLKKNFCEDDSYREDAYCKTNGGNGKCSSCERVDRIINYWLNKKEKELHP